MIKALSAVGSIPPLYITGLAVATVVFLGLCVLVGILSLIVSLIGDERITIRKWLALAWLASLAAPLVMDGIFSLFYYIIHVAIPGDVYPFSAEQFYTALVLVAIVTLITTMVYLAWLTGRFVLKPLATLNQAAYQVAQGKIPFALPASQLREMAQLAEAFNAMGAALQSSIKHQAELEQGRRFFVSAIVHDLRTPIFSLRGYLEGLEYGLAATPEKATQYIQNCRELADSLERLVADLFIYTRLDYLEQEPQREPLEFGVLLRKAVEHMRPQAETKGIRLVENIPDGMCMVRGDAHLLVRAVENVLDNAIRYTPSGGHIQVRLCRELKGCTFTILDNGPGFTPRDLSDIFNPLYRGEASRNRETGGAGLGLTIARRILLAHEGDLHAANHYEGGAKVTGTISMPAQRAAMSEIAPLRLTSQRSSRMPSG